MKPLDLFYDRSYGYIRGLLTILLGVACIVWPDKAKEYTCLILGLIILILGFSALVRSNFGKEGKVLNLLSINGFVDIIFGLVLIIFSDFFVNLMTFLFGFLLLVFGIGSLVEIISAKRQSGLKQSLWLFPVLITLLGIGMFFMPRESSNFLFRLFGIAMLVYGIFELVVQGKIRRIQKEIVEDVPFEEVKTADEE